MTSYTNGGTPSKGATHRIIIGEGVTVEPIDKPTELPKYSEYRNPLAEPKKSK